MAVLSDLKLFRNMKPVLDGIKQRLDNFFENAEEDGHNDPLLDVVRLHPEKSVKFIRVTMLFGVLSTVVVGAACCVFLAMYWRVSGLCNRPLRWWLLFYTVLQIMQVPVRAVFYMRLNRVTEADQHLRETVRRITGSLAWRTSKKVSILTYGWFILGIVWIINSAYCPACPGLYRLSVAVALASTMRLVITLVFFYAAFPRDMRAAEQQPAPKAASQEVLEELPVIKCTAENHTQACGSSCAVCLCDFEVGEQLRPLPCKHVFHRGCIDRWLKRNGVCPLCMQDVQQGQEANKKHKCE